MGLGTGLSYWFYDHYAVVECVSTNSAALKAVLKQSCQVPVSGSNTQQLPMNDAGSLGSKQRVNWQLIPAAVDSKPALYV
jgi:hypothetical protein